jgi:hypothetical protein
MHHRPVEKILFALVVDSGTQYRHLQTMIRLFEGAGQRAYDVKTHACYAIGIRWMGIGVRLPHHRMKNRPYHVKIVVQSRLNSQHNLINAPTQIAQYFHRSSGTWSLKAGSSFN